MPTADSYQNVLIALCVWREARGEPAEAQRGVLHVILNRTRDKRWPNTPVQVITQPKQFSSFNLTDPNVTKYPNPADASWLRCCAVVDAPGEDPTIGATHYHSEMPLPPSWAEPQKLVAKIGNFSFYKL